MVGKLDEQYDGNSLAYPETTCNKKIGLKVHHYPEDLFGYKQIGAEDKFFIDSIGLQKGLLC